MSLLVAEELSLSYGKKVLFDRASFTVGPRDRIGLVGANGTGKSSLVKILAGQLQPDSGRVAFRRRARPGYLPQDVAHFPPGPLVEAVLSTVPGRDELLARLTDVEGFLGQTEDEAELIELSQQLADLHEELEHFDEHFGRHRAESILLGLGFGPDALDRDSQTFSGGWRMRAALAGLLLQDPDLLLLDEPTNHLDLPTLEWLDAFLRQSAKALVLISHDRDFLNRQIDRVISLEPEGLRSYTGNFERYVEQREQELEQLEALADRQATRRAEIEAFINRFRAKASKARQVQSRIKLLEKEETVQLVKARATARFRFSELERSGREVLRLRGIHKSFGPKMVYENLNASLERDQRVAVVGLNGTGKTTLLKLVAGELSPDGGEIRLGHNVTLGYFAQHHAEALDRDARVLDEVWQLVPAEPEGYVRGVLGAFLFSGDDVDKRVGVLSGGERARVALAKLLVRPANFLLLDEPTNHLDLDSSEALINALADYSGTLLFVSHNRSFLNRLATHVWDVRDRTVAPYPGNLDEYLAHLRAAVAPQANGPRPPDSPKAPPTAKDRRRAEAEERQRRSAVEGPLKKEIAALEANIAALEADQKAREAQLADTAVYQDFDQARPLLEAHRKGKDELERLLAAWEDAQHRLAKVTQTA